MKKLSVILINTYKMWLPKVFNFEVHYIFGTIMLYRKQFLCPSKTKNIFCHINHIFTNEKEIDRKIYGKERNADPHSFKKCFFSIAMHICFG